MRVARLTLAILAAALFSFAAASAQDPPKDDALDRLLEQVEATAGDDAKNPETEAAGEVKSKDEALDGILEDLSKTSDEPTAEDGEPSIPAPGPVEPGQEQPPDQLSERDQVTDEHLRDLTGRVSRKDQEPPAGEQASGPQAELIKKMRSVEDDLGKPDTGEETRRKQEEIVKDLDRLLQQARKMQSQQGKGRPVRMVQVPGQPPGDPQDSATPGAQPGNPRRPPVNPDGTRSMANAKDEWGHLPADLKGEMLNVSNERPLDKKKDLVDHYYDSIARKSLARSGE